MASKKFYAVWAGHTPGIYTTWAEAERQVKGYPKAGFKSFPTRALAEAAYAQGGAASAAPKAPKVKKANTNNNTLSEDVAIYCDGACDPNPGKAGTGIAIYENNKLSQLWYGLYNPAGTNNTAELLGLHHSLMFAKEHIEHGHSVTIYCDSKYSIDCITKWAISWQANGWKKKNGEIKNLDIIKPAHALYTAIANDVQVKHVKGHAGVEGNELADRMSVVAIELRETDLAQYTETLSIAEILSMVRG